MAAKPLSSVTYWNHFVRYSEEQNIDISRVLSSISPDENQDFVPFDDLKALVSEINDQHKYSWFGFDVAHNLRVSSHGSLGFAVTHGLDLKECLVLLTQYYQTRMQAMGIRAHVTSNHYHLVITETCDWQPVRTAFYEVLSLSILNIIEYVIGNEVKECCVNFPYPEPEWGQKYHEFLPCRVKFGSNKSSIDIPLPLLSIPCLSSNSRSVDFAKNQCDIEMARLTKYETLSEKITYLVEKNNNYGMTVEVAATQLNMSKSTLTRRLKVEDITFKELLEDLKKQQSVNLLLNSELTVEVIALELGYEGSSNFGRSFKRWFSCSPSAYRQKHT